MTESPPWSHPIAWSAAGTVDSRLLLQADVDVRARVARFLDLEGVGKLEATVSARAWLDGMELNGRVVATLTRLCGVSLETFEESVDAPLHIRLVPVGSANAPVEHDGQVIIDLDADDPPDVVEGGVVDIAACAVEALALALDPFPRKPGAVFKPPAETLPASPFSVLRDLSLK